MNFNKNDKSILTEDNIQIKKKIGRPRTIFIETTEEYLKTKNEKYYQERGYFIHKIMYYKKKYVELDIKTEDYNKKNEEELIIYLHDLHNKVSEIKINKQKQKILNELKKKEDKLQEKIKLTQDKLINTINCKIPKKIKIRTPKQI